jgi:hypothetical protein
MQTDLQEIDQLLTRLAGQLSLVPNEPALATLAAIRRKVAALSGDGASIARSDSTTARRETATSGWQRRLP